MRLEKEAPSAAAEGASSVYFRVSLEVEPDSESEDSGIENSESLVIIG